MRHKLTKTVWCVAVFAVCLWQAGATTCTWDGGGANNLASTPANWSGDVAPVANDDIVLDATTNKNVTWDLNFDLHSWTQVAYSGTVTVRTIYGSAGFTNLNITSDCIISNGVWTHQANTGGAAQTDLLRVSVGGSFVLGPSAFINVDEMGYDAAKGPGALPAGNGGGASYGGRALQAQSNPTILGTYGSITTPVDLGSGASQRGGGAVYLVVNGASTIDGTITADGKVAPAGWNGPGSGGSIYLKTASLTGGGDIGANGGSTVDATPTGGGGGRVAIILTGSATFGTVGDNAHAYGGVSTKGNGPAGTVYYERNTDVAGRGKLKVDNNGKAPWGDTDLNTQAAVTNTFSELALGNGGLLGVGPDDALILTNAPITGYAANNNDGIRLYGRLVVDDTWVVTNLHVDVRSSSAVFNPTNSLTIGTNATLFINAPFTNACNVTLQAGGNLSHWTNGNTEVFKMNYTILGNLTVDAGGTVNVDGRGYLGGGPGIAGATGTSGGSHGGRGGNYNNTGASGPCYGSITAPVALGSDPTSTGGGGAIRLLVSGTTVLNGSMSANALVNSPGPGAGSGGSVFLTTSNLTGNGSISANGNGNTLFTDKGRGGGGRVAVVLTGGTDFGGVTMAAYAGANNGAKGGAGTIYLRTKDQDLTNGVLIVKGDANSTDWTEISSGVTGASVGDVLIQPSYGKLRLTNQTLNVSGVFSNGSSFVATNGAVVNFVGTNTSKVYGNLVFQSLNCTVPGKRLEFSAGSSNSVMTALTLTGDASSNLVLRSTTPGTQWKINAAAAVNPVISYVDVQDSDASPGKKLVGLNTIDSLNNTNWDFVNPGQTDTWTGTVSADWSTAGNWDKNRAPIVGDNKVVIAGNCPNYPAFLSAQTFNNLELQNGASLRLNGNNLTVNQGTVIAGSLIASNTETVTFCGDASFAGGSFTPATSTVILGGTNPLAFASAGNPFYAVRVTNTTVVTLPNALSAVSFSSEGASVTYGGGLTANVLRISVAGAAVTQTFAAASSSQLQDLYVLGAAGSQVVLKGAAAWHLHVTRSAFVKYAAVSYSDAGDGKTLYPAYSSDGGNNPNWNFGDAWGSWSGTANTDFANSNNWASATVPNANTRVEISGGANTPVIATTGTVKSLTLGMAQSSALTVNAPLTVCEDLTVGGYGSLTLNRPAVVTGNVTVVAGGVLTHSVNAGAEVNKLTLSVGGNLGLDAGAFINVDQKGYAAGQGLGRPVSGQSAASYGGKGGGYLGDSGPTYGSVLAPTNLGSGTSLAGGGAVWITVANGLSLNGTISANGGTPANGSGAAGGSVYLAAASLAGSGAIMARGGGSTPTDKGDGGGGRIAVMLSGAESFGNVSMDASSTDGMGSNGAPGTVYCEKASQANGRGVVTLDNKGLFAGGAAYTYLMPEVQAVPNELRYADVVVTNTARMKLSGTTAVGDIHIYPGALLDLTTFDLNVRTRQHDLGGGTTNSAGGQIIWPRGSTFVMR